MKRVSLGLAALMSCHMVVMSLGRAQSPVFFGVHGGVVYSNPWFPAWYPEHRHRTGLTVGGLIGYRLSETFALILEVNDVPKGANFLVFEQYNESLSAEVLECPLLLQARAATGPLSLYFEAGPSLAMKIWEKYDADPHVIHTANIKVYYSENELEAAIGAGMTYRVYGALSVFVSARYTRGFSDLDQIGAERMRSSEVTVSTGVLFNRQ